MTLFFFISFPILLRALLCWLNFGGVQRVNLTFNAISSLSLRSSRLCRSHLMCRIIFAIEFFAVHTSGYSILIQPDLYNLTPLLSYKMKSNEKYLRSFLMFSQKFDHFSHIMYRCAKFLKFLIITNKCNIFKILLNIK